MLKGFLNKGLVKYSLGFLIIILFCIFLYFGPISGEGITGFAAAKLKPELMDFFEIGDGTGDNQEPTQQETPEPEEIDSSDEESQETKDSDSESNVFIGRSSRSSSGGSSSSGSSDEENEEPPPTNEEPTENETEKCVEGKHSTGNSPDEARLHEGDDVTSEVEYSDDVYATQSVLYGTEYIYLEWEFNNLSDYIVVIDNVTLSLEHREDQVLIYVEWFNGSEYVEVCDPPEYSVDTVSECDLSPFIDKLEELGNVEIRLKLVKNETCHEYLDWAHIEINYTVNCGECVTDDDCDHLDSDYCESEKVMHVEGVCADWMCTTGTPTEVEDCNDYDTGDYCDEEDVLKYDDGYCLDAVCEVNTTVKEYCGYKTEYCDFENRVNETGFCNAEIAKCDDKSYVIEDCSVNKYDDCENTYYKVHYTETCQEDNGLTQCIPSSSIIDCRDDLWCNGEEYCSDFEGVHCEAGEFVDCSSYDIPQVTTCFNDPDNIDYTWDHGEAFASVCNETEDACTTGEQTLTHTCSIDLCGAECEEDSDCSCPQDGCVGPDWYEYPNYGVCMEDCMCDVSEEPCDDPCKPTITEDDPRCSHYVCNYDQYACLLAEGSGQDECSTYDNCVHTECNYVDYKCDTIESSGVSECVTFDDCEQHMECNYEQEICEIVEGAGQDECWNYDDCMHNVCSEMSCITVNSPGTDECYHDSECYDLVCNYNDLTCDKVQGAGVVECYTFGDCPQHRLCNYDSKACVIVEGEGDYECWNYDDCVRNVCEGMSCVSIESPGTDECYSDFNCIDYVCNYEQQTCDVVAGTGYAECWTFEDCPQHNACDYDQFICKAVEGTGTDECQTWADCAFCGDGIIQEGEECEDYTDCTCPEDRCHHRYPNLLVYPDYSTCSEEDCSCTDCEPVESICHSDCMGDCKVEVWVGHDMNPNWGYPYTATDDIYIVAEDVSNGACDGWTIRIRYWWCSCSNNDPEQSAIEVTRDDFSAKYDRLCSANAAGEDNPTHSLQCSPCEWRDYRPEFSQDDGKKFWTGVGTSAGTFQIDLRDYYECYTRRSALNQGKAVALGCAAKSEDDPECIAFGDDICESFGCIWQDVGCTGGSFACSNIRKRATCTNVGCEWKSDTETEGDFCRKPTSDPFSFNCAQITNKANCNDYTNEKCSWVEEAYCKDPSA